jgi:hypothetical protein
MASPGWEVVTVFETLAAQMRAYGGLLNGVIGEVAALPVQGREHELDNANLAAVDQWAQALRSRLGIHFEAVRAMHDQLHAAASPDAASLKAMLATLLAWAPMDERNELRALGESLPRMSVPRALVTQLFKVGVPALALAHKEIVLTVAQAAGVSPPKSSESPVAPASSSAKSAPFPAMRLPECVLEQLSTVGYRKGWLIVESHGGATIADAKTRPVLHGTPLNPKSLNEAQVSHLQGKMVSADVAYGINVGHVIEVGDDFEPLAADPDHSPSVLPR